MHNAQRRNAQGPRPKGHLRGQGFGTEIALSVVQYGFDVLDMRAIRASTDVANAASIRVLQKARVRVVRRETVAGLDTVFFELRRPGPSVPADSHDVR
jgi:RimJ/RimL family protein N-acetyltransferase